MVYMGTVLFIFLFDKSIQYGYLFLFFHGDIGLFLEQSNFITLDILSLIAAFIM